LQAAFADINIAKDRPYTQKESAMNQTNGMIRNLVAKRFMALSVVVLALTWNQSVAAHCDTVDGPVVERHGGHSRTET
jgi:hypothetical protein